MPRKSGHEGLEAIKDDSDLRSIPVIILTSSEAEADIVRSYVNHANASLTKPVDPDEFTDVVQTFERFWLEIVILPDCDD